MISSRPEHALSTIAWRAYVKKCAEILMSVSCWQHLQLLKFVTTCSVIGTAHNVMVGVEKTPERSCVLGRISANVQLPNK